MTKLSKVQKDLLLKRDEIIKERNEILSREPNPYNPPKIQLMSSLNYELNELNKELGL